MWKLNQFQSTMLLASSFMPLTYYFFTRTAVEYSGYYSLWTIIAMIGVGLIIGWLHSKVNACFPGVTGADYTVIAFGKWLGKTISILNLPIYWVFVGLSIHYYVMTMKPFLPNTPVWAINGSMVAVACLGAYRGIEALGRAASVIAVLTLFGNLSTMVFLIFGGEHRPPLVYALPHSFVPIMSGIYHMLPMYFGYSICLMLNPYDSRRRYPYWAVLTNAPMIIGNFVMNIKAVGYNAILNLQYPFPFVIQLLRLTGFIIERLGITVVIVATAFTTAFVANHLWALSTLTSRITGKPDGNFRKFLLAMVVPIYLVSTFMDEGLDNIILNNYLVPASWVFLVLFPLAVLIASKVKGLPQNIEKYKENLSLESN